MSEATESGKVQNFYPISHLSLFTQLIDEQLEHDLGQLASLQQAETRPHVLDDAIVERIIKLYTEAADIRGCHQRQLSRWRTEHPTEEQLQEIMRLEEQVKQLEKCHSTILELAKRLEGKTIERVLGKSDVEVALDFLSELL